MPIVTFGPLPLIVVQNQSCPMPIYKEWKKRKLENKQKITDTANSAQTLLRISKCD